MAREIEGEEPEAASQSALKEKAPNGVDPAGGGFETGCVKPGSEGAWRLSNAVQGATIERFRPSARRSKQPQTRLPHEPLTQG